MPTELKMPALSPTMEEGTLARWLVKVGDSVSSGDLLAEIETDKATMEFEAIDDGVVTQLLVAEGAEGVKVGTVIALIQGEDDDVKVAPKVVAAEPKAEIAVAVTAAPAAPAPATKAAADDRVKSSPLAKRIAAELGVDLATVTGTGPNGRIVKEDVEAAASGGAASAPKTATTTVSAEPVEVRVASTAFDKLSPNGILAESKEIISHLLHLVGQAQSR